MFREVKQQVDFPAMEREVIEFWNEHRVFRRSVDRHAPRGDWVFYEGPPTANGKPGVHHVISRSYKDLFPRFKTMQGYRVGRKGGWDTHGLPVEIAVEKRLGFTSKQQIEEFGIEEFNRLCREDVFSNIQDWNAMTERIGFWIDLDDAYVTYHNSYIESCWWIMKQLFDRGLLVEDYKTTWHSPSSNTTLASHEVAQGYKEDVEDPSVFPKFRAVTTDLREHGMLPEGEDRPVSFLAWTTTPWTLPANSGLAVMADATYALAEGPARAGGTPGAELYVLAEDRLEALGEERGAVLATMKGADLVGCRYLPVMVGGAPDDADLAGAYRVVADEIVTLDDGTGIVHVAPAYGDLDVGRRHGLPTIFSVDLTGSVMDEVRPLPRGLKADSPFDTSLLRELVDEPVPFAGAWFKDADEEIIGSLQDTGLMYAAGTIRHSYPFNWRDWKPLMNVAKRSWYVRTTAVKDLLLSNNDVIGWHPEHMKEGRFGRWLENNVDWALSRERYWGATLPIWRSEDGQRVVCVGSVAELQELAGRDLSGLDLHRPYVDDVTFELDGQVYRREPYTVDVWFESGAMPYAQWHFMGQDSAPGVTETLVKNFPADYICEAVDQTRGWFYSLHALATLLTDPGDAATGREPGALAHLFEPTSSFKNLNVLGHIVDENGEKMSKSKGNVVDPWTVLDKQGADALRWYCYSSSPAGQSKRFSSGLVEEVQRDFFLTLWNVYGFFVLYANLEEPDLSSPPPVADRPLIDRWLVARLQELTETVTAALEDFDPTTASRAIRDLVVDELSNWYVRRNRKRFWRGREATEDERRDSLAAYATLHDALVTVAKLMAPMAPFTSEEVYRNLELSVRPDAEASVHLAAWPVAETASKDAPLVTAMRALMRLVELGRAARSAAGLKLRQPLAEVLVRVRDEEELAVVKLLEDQLKEELNVKSVRFLDVTDDFVDYQVKPNLPRLGKRLGNRLPALRAALTTLSGREVAANVRDGRPTVVSVAGEDIELSAEDLLLDARSPEGYAAQEERGYLAALATEVTRDLRLEGLARDVVRLVQNARKEAGLEVSDRIELSLSADGELREALERHGDEVASEVLATDLYLGEQPAGDEMAPTGDAHVETHELDGMAMRLELRRK